jgi:hypothetical protein
VPHLTASESVDAAPSAVLTRPTSPQRLDPEQVDPLTLSCGAHGGGGGVGGVGHGGEDLVGSIGECPWVAGVSCDGLVNCLWPWPWRRC